jgi:hypothetical protein
MAYAQLSRRAVLAGLPPHDAAAIGDHRGIEIKSTREWLGFNRRSNLHLKRRPVYGTHRVP